MGLGSGVLIQDPETLSHEIRTILHFTTRFTQYGVPLSHLRTGNNSIQVSIPDCLSALTACAEFILEGL